MTLAQARDIAIVFLSIPAIIAFVFPLVALAFAVKGLHIARSKVRPVFPVVQDYFAKLTFGTHRVSRLAVSPMMGILQRQATLKGIWHGVTAVVGRTVSRYIHSDAPVGNPEKRGTP
jgi:hypothetical protein